MNKLSFWKDCMCLNVYLGIGEKGEEKRERGGRRGKERVHFHKMCLFFLSKKGKIMKFSSKGHQNPTTA